MDRSAFLKKLKAGVEMNKLQVDRNKNKTLSKDALLLLTKEELVDIVIQLQANTTQLKNVIAKKNEERQKSKERRKEGKDVREFDFSRFQTRRIFLRIAYLGANYRGLAVQEDCPDTIEAHLFKALVKGCLIKARSESHYHRCGRTDKGVSASGQVISLEVRSRLSLDEQLSRDRSLQELPYCKILNRLLPPDIRAVAWMPAPLADVGEYSSARFDCKQRTYKYWFPRGSLDLGAMGRACTLLMGSNDFRNLCKMDVANGVTTFTRDVKEARIVSVNSAEDKGYDMHYLLVRANAFLWHQIRCMAGILFLVGGGREEPSIITDLLDIDTNPRKPQYNMAIDLPLNLFHCAYDFLEDYDEATRLRTLTPAKETITPRKSNEPSTCEEISNKDVTSTIQERDIDVKQSIDSNRDFPLDEDSLMNDLSCRELDKIEEQIQESDGRERERVESLESADGDGRKSDTEFLDDPEPMQHSDDENMMLSGKIEVKKDWWRVDPEDLSLVIKNFQTQWSKFAIQAAMIRDIIDELESLYSREVGGPAAFLHQSDCMLQGVSSKVYQPLLKRTTCESLENRIEHYVNKKRLRPLSDDR